jgi:pimeloyl-ACP methyl ester carboxylesterase
MKQLMVFICLFVMSWLPLSHAQQTKQPTVVFVHGAWGGGWDYKLMASLLEPNGYEVYRPSLTGLGERAHLNGPSVNLETHITDIVNLIQMEELSNVILVGHSYGGMVITGVADRIPEHIAQLVYADAMLPNHGESVFSLDDDQTVEFFTELANSRGQGWSIPTFWPNPGKDVAHPLESFKQPIALTNPARNSIPSTYILTIEPGAETDDFSEFAQRAKARGWRYHELPTGHNLQRTMPHEYAEIIMNLD